MLFGSSGIRRLYDQDLLSLAMQVGMAVGGRADQVLVGMDSRTTGPALSSSFIAGICSTGAKALQGGIAPTPSIAYCCRSFQAACMVTASHNPEPYNGLKLFNPDGSSFQALQQDEIEDAISDIRVADWLSQGEVMKYDPLTPHRDAILNEIDVKKDLPVILDCGNGAGSVLTPHLLSDAGASVTAVNANPSGTFSRPSEPLVENLPYLTALMKKVNARCAVVHDGDADRMMAFDNTGTYIPGDLLLILFAKYLGSKRVVTTYDASMAVEEIAEVRRTPVGDAFVSEQLVQWGDFGGEPSGAWIFPQISYCPDGPFAAGLFCEMAGEWNIAEEIASIPKYPIIRRSQQFPQSHEILYALGAANPTDGLRLEEDDGWCLVRASGTEPKIRFTAEGRTLDDARRMLERGEEMVRLALRGDA
ncbi:MAG TPA: phosphopentomutase/phosphoglucosamine mutase [Methanospirillum sp.]|uniref:phosphopentomutase/phosphoglucosamine mutase n=1 Tax=Methanospirillum sp. TaxID=45200 RepID=UPI002BEF81E2|nr:phosphopentomutase/phosphoglucosamine mutase [Methanospirillum sp.]HWQ63169.1 phosphopentomutase/phosphoglucosamine mutase [Methanospirillum sp.]